MRVIIEPDYEKLSAWAANYVASRIIEANPTPEKPFKLGCPTGSSPLGLYKELIRMYKEGKISFQNVITFNMDEYVNLPEEHPESYHSFMWNNFFSHIDIKKENVHILNGNAEDLKAECEAYEEAIKAAMKDYYDKNSKFYEILAKAMLETDEKAQEAMVAAYVALDIADSLVLLILNNLLS